MILPSASPVSWLLALAAALAYAAPAAAASRLGAAASRNALLVAWVLHGALLVWGLWLRNDRAQCGGAKNAVDRIVDQRGDVCVRVEPRFVGAIHWFGR